MKNKFGQSLTSEQAKEMWDDAEQEAYVERGRDLSDLLNDKACNVYHVRVREAEANGATFDELDDIDEPMDVIRQKIDEQICHTPDEELGNAWFYWMGYIEAKRDSGEINKEEYFLLCSHIGIVTKQ